jgi:hypothetical protein
MQPSLLFLRLFGGRAQIPLKFGTKNVISSTRLALNLILYNLWTTPAGEIDAICHYLLSTIIKSLLSKNN